MSLKTVEVLQLFNEKVTKLQSLGFSERFSRDGAHAIVEWRRGKGWDSVFVGPADDSVAAVVLTLRFFIQDNEPTSIRRVADLYQTEVKDSNLVKQFLDLRTELNAYLDSETDLGIVEERNLTRREIFDFFMYGDLAHANEGKYRTYKDLERTDFFPIFQVIFASTLTMFLHTLQSMNEVNEKALASLSTKPR